ncbi:hypothetical protein [Bradyrhizobium sp. th.b2]|uniref:hypothetical protein n=1 Tax=Bradyrhizobium sp. th-b2 TaxID=172088 RepID=UPI000401E49A|nr:hypothetical protein [Bradyrhizobium sp. th.b2]
MSKFTKELRRKIVEDFSRRHNGQYDPALFLKEVGEIGETHPAHGWFEWDGDKAAKEYNLWQARAFVKDLRITFEVEEVSGGKPIKITIEAPMMISPVAGRSNGGGYVCFNPDDPTHQAEHCNQAAAALRSWLNRYQAALIHAGFGVKSVEMIAVALEAVHPPAVEQAAA